MSTNTIIADLHNHSTASDGEYSPAGLVEKAKELGLEAIGLTDHDNISGLDEALEAGRRSGITVVPGVEVSLRFTRSYFVGSLHLLLYFTEDLLRDAGFRRDLNDLLGQGRGVALVMDRVAAINREFGPDGVDPLLKKPLSVDEITSYSDNVTRRHFFMALSEKHGIRDKSLTDRIISNSSPAYIPSGIEMKILRPFFEKYHVVKIFSHPAAGSFPGDSHYKEVLPPIGTVEKLLPEFLNKNIVGIDGLEVYYPGHTEELENILLDWAGRYNLLITGGSDCHDNSVRPPGVCGITKDNFDKFIAALNN